MLIFIVVNMILIFQCMIVVSDILGDILSILHILVLPFGIVASDSILVNPLSIDGNI